MNLRSETTLAVQFTENNGLLRTLLFVALPSRVDDIIMQETVRREELFNSIYEAGPEYVSSNYGTITFQEDGRFNWSGNMLLVPQVIPGSALGTGRLDMGLFLSSDISERYTGAFTLNFDGIGGVRVHVNFMYSLEPQGLRIEHAPQNSLDGINIVRRASSPLVIYFYKSDRADNMQSGGWDIFQETFDIDLYRDEAEDYQPEFELEF
jgi:hypothetical protein